MKLFFTESTNTCEITPSTINMLFTCNHHEVDTHIALHTLRSIKPVIITATDTDVLVLLTHACRQCNNAKQWLMKTNPEIFIDIARICNFFGKGMRHILSGFHSITVCNTTCNPFGIVKISPFQKMHGLSKM